MTHELLVHCTYNTHGSDEPSATTARTAKTMLRTITSPKFRFFGLVVYAPMTRTDPYAATPTTAATLPKTSAAVRSTERRSA